MTTVEVSPVDCFNDAEEGSVCSRFYSTNGGSFDDFRFSVCNSDGVGGGVGSESRRSSSAAASELSVELVEIKVHFGKEERDCRICHLSLESANNESGVPIELGCSCKDDLAAAHKHCAEAWFKIKGNTTCEICNSIARNVAGGNEVEPKEPSNEDSSTVAAAEPPAALPITPETRRCWNGHRFLNFLLACMVFAFILSWLFHFNVPS